MGTRIVEGKDSLIHTNKDQTKLYNEKSGNDGQAAEWTDADTESLSVSFGRTIHLGNYEFARVGFGVKTGLLFPVVQEERDVAYRRMHDTVEEVLDREEAFLRGEDRKFEGIDLNGVGVNVAIWMDYGLTFKVKGMDSQKVDTSSSRRLSDGSDFEEKVAILQKEIGERIGAYKKRVLGADGDVGF